MLQLQGKYILLEAPTGFGKSPVSIAVGRTLGTSYICPSPKDLQTQYSRDFPLQNRPIYPLNIAYLNFNNLRLQEIKANIAMVIDNLMTLYRNHKGVIHTTSYEQLNFIRENISQTNKRQRYKGMKLQQNMLIVQNQRFLFHPHYIQGLI